MATLIENATRIKNTFDEIKEAIIGKGVTPSGDVTTYASAIDSIETGGGGGSSQYPLAIEIIGNVSGTTEQRLVGAQIIDDTYFTESSGQFSCRKAGTYKIVGSVESVGSTSNKVTITIMGGTTKRYTTDTKTYWLAIDETISLVAGNILSVTLKNSGGSGVANISVIYVEE